MVKQSRITFILLFIVHCALCISLSSCAKKEEVTPVSTTPVIELSSVSSSSVNEGDPITFRIRYTDGDGDLGENSSTVNNMFLVDNRINITYDYRVQQLAPSGSNISITGYLNLDLKSTAVTSADTLVRSQQVTYSIYLVDRAGHQSNIITTPAITINR